MIGKIAAEAAAYLPRARYGLRPGKSMTHQGGVQLGVLTPGRVIAGERMRMGMDSLLDQS
jgi:hypothetical protein